ncbi:DUF5686 family protein [Schleiferia thermophila]|jgi:hypothetical protein|uniref:Carboxypeptidase-like protein n=5 Tax=Schleiferia thermophila TaxID=884107 RepID=A0A369A9M0_9FLAO|nr:DUF5686 family protein [Schleiferia thermophila]RCX04787.1 carboxypeptidase-like protein [Schleiferia thermophila]
MVSSIEMRRAFVLLTCFCFVVLKGASQYFSGTLVDASTGERLPFGHISSSDFKRGVTSDIEGRFAFKLLPQDTVLIISYAGYQRKEIDIRHYTCSSNCVISLKPTPQVLGEVNVFPGENPALRIIRQASSRRKENDPENLESFSYKAYNKFIMSFDTNDLKTITDSLTPDKIDSFALKAIELAGKQYLFLSESVSERRYLRPNKVNETVIASRISGLKNPLFSILATQLQSFTFYKDEFELFNITLDNPLSPKAERQYFYLIEDTLYNLPNADTTFIISFRPRPSHEHKGMKGLLYIATPDYAISNVIASPGKEQNFNVSIQQLYEKIEGRWFPMQLNSDFKILNVAVNGLHLYGRMRSYHSYVNLSPGLKFKDFRSIDIRINPDAAEKDSVFWSQFRVHPLTEMEQRTYEVIDSLGDALNLDRRLLWLKAFTEGKIRVKFIDLELDRILSFNLFEGLRTGIGLSTNERFHPRFTAGGFAGYGWGDRIWKFGYKASYQLYQPYNVVIGAGYSYDMMEAGQPFFAFSTRRNVLESAARKFYATGWDYVSSAFGYAAWEWTPRFKNQIRYVREFRKHGQDYYFYYPEKDIAQFTNGLAIHFLESSMEFAPNDVVTETFLGRQTIRFTYPRYYFTWMQSITSIPGELQFAKLDFKILHRWGRMRTGYLYAEVSGGHVSGGAPYGYLYTGRANLYNGESDRFRRFSLADRSSFETMLFNEYLMDTYLQTFLRYDTRNMLFGRKPNRPHLEVVYRVLYGLQSQADVHFLVNTSAPRGIFQEVGLELNRVLSNLGVGMYYRISPVNTTMPGMSAFLLKLTNK